MTGIVESAVLGALSSGCRSVYWLAEQVPEGEIDEVLADLERAGKIVCLSRAVIHGRSASSLDVYALAGGRK